MAARVTMPAPPPTESTDQRVILRNVPWSEYEALCAIRGDDAGPRMTYLEGTLEIMSPGRRHEHLKTFIARLIEAYADERAIPLLGFGSESYRREAAQRGLEPDECYCVGDEKDLPDIAIEIVSTSGGIDKLDVYRGLGVPEVWFWVEGRLHLFALGDDGYRPIGRSGFLPELNVDELASLVGRTERSAQAQAVWAFRRSLRGSD
jgi:Uma2 family endonuclease